LVGFPLLYHRELPGDPELSSHPPFDLLPAAVYVPGSQGKGADACASLSIREPLLQKPFSPKALKEKAHEILDGVTVS